MYNIIYIKFGTNCQYIWLFQILSGNNWFWILNSSKLITFSLIINSWRWTYLMCIVATYWFLPYNWEYTSNYMKKREKYLFTCLFVYQLSPCLIRPVCLSWIYYGKGPSHFWNKLATMWQNIMLDGCTVNPALYSVL